MAINTFSGGNPINSLQAAGKNKIINGDFRINQRNFTTTSTYGTYGFDRWFVDSTGTYTYSAQTFTPGTAPVAGYEGINFARLVASTQSSGGDYAAIDQRIEDVRTLAGQTITVSLWAKAATGTPKIGIAIDQNFGSGGSSGVTVSGGTATISTSWARYSFSFALPSMSGKTIGTSSYLNLYLFTSVGTTVSGSGYPAVGLQNATIDFWGVQVEQGNSATSFTTATGTIQGELAACQRYYVRFADTVGSGYSTVCPSGYFPSTTQFVGNLQMPVTMRISPSSVDYATLQTVDNTIGSQSITAIVMSFSNPTTVSISATVSGATATRTGYLRQNNSTAAYLAFNAEL